MWMTNAFGYFGRNQSNKTNSNYLILTVRLRRECSKIKKFSTRHCQTEAFELKTQSPLSKSPPREAAIAPQGRLQSKKPTFKLMT